MPEADLRADAERRPAARTPRARGGRRRGTSGPPSSARPARQRLDRGALREAADPRRRAAAEREEVLPRREAAALGGQRDHAVEQRAQLSGQGGRPGRRPRGGTGDRRRWGRRVGVGAAPARRLAHARHSALALPKLASGWISSPWPGYHWKTTGSPSNVTRAPPSPAAPVHGLRSGCGAFGKPRVRQNSGVAPQLQERGGHARGGQQAAAGERLDAADDGAQLVAALAAAGRPRRRARGGRWRGSRRAARR